MTETGVYNLLENCWDLKSVDLTATGVMILPSQIVGKEVDTAGCPLVSPSEGFVQQYGGLDKMKGIHHLVLIFYFMLLYFRGASVAE